MCGEQDYTPTFNPGEQSFGSSTQPAGNGGTGMSHQNEGRNGNNNNRSDRGGGEAAPSSQSSASLAEATAWMFEWYQQRWAAASSGVQQETEQRQVRRRRRTRRQQQPQQQQAQLPQPEQQQRQVVGVAPSTSLAEPTSVNVNQEQQVEGQQLVQVGNIGAALPTANPLDVEEQQRNFLAQLNNDALLAWGFDIVNTQTGQPLQHEGQELFVFPSNESQLTAWNESVTINTSVEPLGGQSQQNADVGASATHQYQPQQEQEHTQHGVQQVEQSSFWAVDSSSTNEIAEVNPVTATDHPRQQRLESLMRTWAQLTASAGDNEQERQELDEAFFAAWAGTGGNDTVNSILGGGQGGGLPEQQRQDQPAADEAWDRQDFTAPELALPANWQDTNAIQLDHWQWDTQQQQQHVNGMNGVNGNSTQPQRAEPETRPTTETTTIVNGDDHHTRRMPTRSYIENPGLSFFNFSSSSSRSSSALSASSSQSPNREDGNNGRGSVQDNRRQVRATIARAAESENVQENNNGNANGVTTVDAQNVQRAQEERNNHGDVPMASAPPAITRAGLGRGRREHQPVLNGGGLQLLGREEEGEGRGGRSIYSPPRPPPLVNGFHFPSRPGPSSAAATVAATASAADAVNDRGTWNVAPVRSRVNGVAPTTNTNGHLNGSPATSTTYANGVRSNAGHEGQENNENGEAVDGGLGNGPVHNTSRTNNGDSDSDDSISRLLTFPTCWCCGATLPEVPPVCCDQCGVAN